MLAIDERALFGDPHAKAISGSIGPIVVGPLTYWSLLHEGRWPLLSQWSPGMAEARRQQRRTPRRAQSARRGVQRGSSASKATAVEKPNRSRR